MSLTTHAQSWATYESQLTFLTHIKKVATLTSQQLDFISDTIDHIQSNVEQLESYIFDNYPESYYYDMRNAANSLTINASPEYIDHIESQLVNLDMNDLDYLISKAIKQYNSNYYGCSITLNEYGHISYHGCTSSNSRETTVLFNKGIGYHTITMSDVYNKLNQLQPA